MKIARVFGMVFVLAVMVFCLGCGSSDSSSSGYSDDSGISESQAKALSEQISSAAVNGMNSANWTASLNADTVKTVNCNELGCTYNIPLIYRWTTRLTARQAEGWRLQGVSPAVLAAADPVCCRSALRRLLQTGNASRVS